MWKRCGVLCCVIVAIACLSPVSASPAGRTLTSSEAWSVYGGVAQCYTGMGRCYANPEDCSQHDGDPECENFCIFTSKENSVTCQDSTNAEDICQEIGTQVPCKTTTDCIGIEMNGLVVCVNDDTSTVNLPGTNGPLQGVAEDAAPCL